MSVSIGGSSSLPQMDASQGAEVYAVALSKNHQEMQGEAALALIQAAAQPMPAVSANPAIGSHVNVIV
ncbi:hypothetical protein [Flocculibacter collagenilyticus]|uniref:hypothetical protein n=1 Tax=Flocculibacter collagenilyticus TaxID=2744479 RepID=UPI0018F7804A|nr:hypothetical protein [Flocculibacter collagenilyticus]